MPARIIRAPCTRYQSECRLTFSRIASRMTWAAASSDMVMVRLHLTNVPPNDPVPSIRESAVLPTTLTRRKPENWTCPLRKFDPDQLCVGPQNQRIIWVDVLCSGCWSSLRRARNSRACCRHLNPFRANGPFGAWAEDGLSGSGGGCTARHALLSSAAEAAAARLI